MPAGHVSSSGHRHDGAFLYRGHPTEEATFTAFAQDFPGRNRLLVNTYDTGQGVRTAIEVARRLQLPGPVGVRAGFR